MSKICDTCETAIHCAKYGCIPERIGKPAQPQQQPVAWTVAGQVRDWSKDFSAYQTKHYVRPVYTSPPSQTDWEAVAADQAMTIALLKAEQPAQQEQGDSICQENDGCPTEKAVLQRFWRGQSIPDEHYPAWFKPAQQEPVAWMIWTHGPVRLFLNKDEAQMELERFNREYPVDAGSRKMRPLVFGDTSPPAQRTWVGLTDEEIEKELGPFPLWISDWDHWNIMNFASAIEAKLKELNT